MNFQAFSINGLIVEKDRDSSKKNRENSIYIYIDGSISVSNFDFSASIVI